MTKPKSSQAMSERQYALRVQNKRDAAITANQDMRRKMDEDKAERKAANYSGYELTEADRAKVQRLDGFSEAKGRYYVAPESVPVFRYGSQAA